MIGTPSGFTTWGQISSGAVLGEGTPQEVALDDGSVWIVSHKVTVDHGPQGQFSSVVSLFDQDASGDFVLFEDAALGPHGQLATAGLIQGTTEIGDRDETLEITRDTYVDGIAWVHEPDHTLTCVFHFPVAGGANLDGGTVSGGAFTEDHLWLALQLDGLLELPDGTLVESTRGSPYSEDIVLLRAPLTYTPTSE